MFSVHTFALLSLYRAQYYSSGSVVGSASAVSGYGQCGGQGYYGSTTCVAGYTCQVQSVWYSQCLPGSLSGSSSGGSGGSVPLYGQCGGQGYTGATLCSSGSCQVQSVWYSQCLPGSSSGSSGSAPASTGNTGASVPLYGQCGGQGYTGATTCASGSCVVQSVWYSQCVPAAGSSSGSQSVSLPIPASVPGIASGITNLRPGGSCGGGVSCIYGQCCSSSGNCGNDNNYCSAGCQSAFSPNGCQITQTPSYLASSAAPTCVRPQSSVSSGIKYSTLTGYSSDPGSACPPYTAYPNLGSTPVVALSLDFFPTGTDACGRKVQITIVPNGQSIVATVVDKCQGCVGVDNIDGNGAVWQALGVYNRISEIGRLCYVQWQFI
ncbi:hypothetical protein HDV01_005525 [Terramyces sp. JEL0728]|nr:hypothetical protein HDV01_005525 [Terramyces sp. JEL0728]